MYAVFPFIRRFKALLLVFVAVSYGAEASEFKQEENINDEQLLQVGSWQVQFALGYGQRNAIILGQDDFEFYVAPNIAYYAEQFFFDNGTLGYTFIQQPKWVFSAVAELNPYAKYFDDSHIGNLFIPVTGGVSESSDDDLDFSADSPVTDDSSDGEQTPIVQPDVEPVIESEQIAERDWSVDVGAQVNYFISDTQQLNVKVMRDVSNLHQGWRGSMHWSMSLRQWLPFGLQGQFTTGVSWLDANNANYYFGHRSDFESYNYEVSSAFIPSLSVTLQKPISSSLSLVFHYKYQSLPSEITQSPIVVNNDISTQFAGFNYAF